MSVRILREGRIVAYVHEEELRGVDGLLVNPPKLFCTVYNREKDLEQEFAVLWKVAEALAPNDMRLISARLEELRNFFANERYGPRRAVNAAPPMLRSF